MKLLKNITILRNYASSTKFTPKCSDCKNYIKYINNGKEYKGLSTCLINNYSLKSSKVYFYTETCRNTELYCGKEGKFFNISK